MYFYHWKSKKNLENFSKMIKLLSNKQIFASSDAKFCCDTRNNGCYTQNFVHNTHNFSLDMVLLNEQIHIFIFTACEMMDIYKIWFYKVKSLAPLHKPLTRKECNAMGITQLWMFNPQVTNLMTQKRWPSSDINQ